MREFPNYFADAEESFNNADFIIFGLPYDKTSSFRFGARLAPKEIRKASWNFESFDMLTGVDFTEIPLHDYGDLDIENKDGKEMLESVSRFSKRVIKAKKIPVAIGGEHSVTPGLVEGFDDVFVISLDAHLDFRDEYEGNRYNHACASRRVADKVGIDNIAILGVRSAERKELEKAREEGLKFFASGSLSGDIDDVLKEISKDIGERKVYLSIDFDVLDPAYAPGVSTPEPFGLEPDDVIKVIKTFADRIVGFDLVEVCPPYDFGNTSILAAKVIRIAIAEIWKALKSGN